MVMIEKRWLTRMMKGAGIRGQIFLFLIRLNFLVWEFVIVCFFFSYSIPRSSFAMSFNMRTKKGPLSHQKQKSTVSLPASLKTELGLEASEKSEDGPRNASGIQDEEERRKARRDRANFFAQQRSSNNQTKSSSSKNNRVNGVIGRKEARKALRQEKKSARSQHQVKPKQPINDSRKVTATASKPLANGSRSISENKIAPSSVSKGKRKADDDSERVASTSERAPKSQKKHVKEDTATPLQRLLNKQSGNVSEDEIPAKASKTKIKKKNRGANLTQLEQQEDDEIAWLEANLGLRNSNGKKTKKSSTKGQDEGDDMFEDDLDDFIDDLDRFYPGMYDDNASEGSDDEDESEWDSEEEEMSDDMDDDKVEESISGTDEESEEEDSELDDLNDSEGEEVEENTKEESAVPNTDDVRSAQTPNQESAAIPTPGKYIPPALRRKMEQSQSETISAEEQKLQRAIKGLLNRFGENNLEIIIGEIEELYRQSSRAQVTNYLTKLVLETIALNDNIGDTLVVLYAALITSLHRIVGVEFGAHFIQEMVDLLLKQYGIANASDSNDTTETSAGKQARNLIALMSSLYNLNVIACPLMYDVIRLLLGVEKDKKQTQSTMTELDVDLLLKVVKLCGAQLRHDDPTSLKSIISIAQEQQQKQSQNGQSVSMRAKFMLESMSDLRNNRSRATTASVGAESLTKMRKFLGNLGKKHTIRTHEPLRVGLEDLRNVDKRGKWWLVGAAWAGYDFTSKEGAEKAASKDANKPKKGNNDLDSLEAKEDNIVQLARQHGMNTAIRQQIFVTLLSSQDYLDAVHRLLTMTHKKATQRREIVRVLLHCLAREPSFNPYYVVVGSRLANEDERGTRITMQYCLWDFMRKLGEKNVGGQSILSRQEEEDESDLEEDEDESALAFGGEKGMATEQGMANVARTYGWWMAKGSLTLEALRAVDFTTIRKGVPFVQLLIIHVLLSISSTSPVHTLMPSKGPSSQSDMSKNQKAVETLFVQGTRANQRLAQGLLIFMEQHLTSKKCQALATTKLGLSSDKVASLLKSRMTALETVRVGARLAANDDLDMLD